MTPLITTANGYVIASTNTYPDGRENLAVTVANNPNLVHSQVLSYGLVNWVTRGVFIGERHVNLGVQVDDLFIDSDMWDVDANSDLHRAALPARRRRRDQHGRVAERDPREAELRSVPPRVRVQRRGLEPGHLGGRRTDAERGHPHARCGREPVELQLREPHLHACQPGSSRLSDGARRDRAQPADSGGPRLHQLRRRVARAAGHLRAHEPGVPAGRVRQRDPVI